MLSVTTLPSLIIGTVLWMGLGPQGLRALLGRRGVFTKLVGDAVPKENAKLSHERGMLVPLCLAHLASYCTSSPSRVAGLQGLCRPGTESMFVHGLSSCHGCCRCGRSEEGILYCVNLGGREDSARDSRS